MYFFLGFLKNAQICIKKFEKCFKKLCDTSKRFSNLNTNFEKLCKQF